MIITLFPAWVQSYPGIRTYSYLTLQGMWSSRINKSWISDYFNSMQVCLLIYEMTIPPLKVKWSSPSQGGQGTRRLSGYASTILSFFDVHTSQIFHWDCHRQPNYEVVARKDTHTNHWRPLDSRTRTTRSTRFDLKFFAYCKKINTPEIFIVLSFAIKVSIVIVIEGG